MDQLRLRSAVTLKFICSAGAVPVVRAESRRNWLKHSCTRRVGGLDVAPSGAPLPAPSPRSPLPQTPLPNRRERMGTQTRQWLGARGQNDRPPVQGQVSTPVWPLRPRTRGTVPAFPRAAKARVARRAWPWALLMLSLRDGREQRVCITRHGRVASGVAESGSVL